ncbi:MAG: hypothetical protein M1819_007195 [Sarea resinae]|nr:MAG: hypothetical protein M1819_007195 [Sarea resinae]
MPPLRGGGHGPDSGIRPRGASRGGAAVAGGGRGRDRPGSVLNPSDRAKRDGRRERFQNPTSSILANGTNRNTATKSRASSSFKNNSMRFPSASTKPQTTGIDHFGKGQGWRDPTVEGNTDYMKRMNDFYQKLKKDRENERREAIAQGFLADPNKAVSLADAITPVGTCQDMCPEFERVERIVQNEVKGPEKVTIYSTSGENDKPMPSEGRMVKKFRRSAAGHDEQLPSDIRPPLVLKKTLDYLMNDVVGNCERLGDVHHFVWDRTRAIRNDFSIQQLTKAPDLTIAIECFERIARFHILSLHLLSLPGSTYSEYTNHQEQEQLDKTLLSLMYYYDDSRKVLHSPNEAEFRAYCIIFQIRERCPDTEERAQRWPKNVLWDPRVQRALKLYSAAGNTLDTQGPLQPYTTYAIAQGNYGRFWAMLASSEISYLMACVAEIYFNHIRKTALTSIVRAYKQGGQSRNEDWTLSELAPILGFDEEQQAEDFCEAYGLTIIEKGDGEACLEIGPATGKDLIDPSPPPQQVFSEILVESKRYRRTLPAIINGLGVIKAREQGLIEEEPMNGDTIPPKKTNDSLFLTEDSDEASETESKSSTNGARSNQLENAKLNPSAPTFNPFNPFGLPSSNPPTSKSPNAAVPSSPAPPAVKFGAPAQSPSPSLFGMPSTAFGKPSTPRSAETPPLNTMSSTPSTLFGTPNSFGTGNPPATTHFGTSSSSNTGNPSASSIFGAPSVSNPFAKPLPPSPAEAPGSSGSSATTATPATAPQSSWPSTSFGSPTFGSPFLQPQAKPAPSPKPLEAEKPLPPTSNVSAILNESSQSKSSFPPPTQESTPFKPSTPSTLFQPLRQFQPPPISTPPAQPPSSFVQPNPTSPLFQPAEKKLEASGKDPLSLVTKKVSATPPLAKLPAAKSESTSPPTGSTDRPVTFKPPPDIAQTITPPAPPLGPTPEQRRQKAQETRKTVLDNLAHTSTLEPNGLLQQFIDHTVSLIASCAKAEFEEESLRRQADDLRQSLLARRFVRRWKDICWKLSLLRKGRERRQRYARDMQALVNGKGAQRPDIETEFEQFRRSARESKVNGTTSPHVTVPQPQYQQRPLRKRKSLPSDFRTTMASEADQHARRVKQKREDVADALPSTARKDKLSRSQLITRHHRSSTLDHAALPSPASEALSLSLNGGSPTNWRTSPNSSTSSLNSFFLSGRSLLSNSVLERAKALVPSVARGGRMDSTHTNYFRMKALGLDPGGGARKRKATEAGEEEQREMGATSRVRAKSISGGVIGERFRRSAPGAAKHSHSSSTSSPLSSQQRHKSSAAVSSSLLKQRQTHLSPPAVAMTPTMPANTAATGSATVSPTHHHQAARGSSAQGDDDDEALFAQLRSLKDAMSESRRFFQDAVARDDQGRSSDMNSDPEVGNPAAAATAAVGNGQVGRLDPGSASAVGNGNGNGNGGYGYGYGHRGDDGNNRAGPSFGQGPRGSGSGIHVGVGAGAVGVGTDVDGDGNNDCGSGTPAGGGGAGTSFDDAIEL